MICKEKWNWLSLCASMSKFKCTSPSFSPLNDPWVSRRVVITQESKARGILNAFLFIFFVLRLPVRALQWVSFSKPTQAGTWEPNEQIHYKKKRDSWTLSVQALAVTLVVSELWVAHSTNTTSDFLVILIQDTCPCASIDAFSWHTHSAIMQLLWFIQCVGLNKTTGVKFKHVLLIIFR